jgi:aspartyl-tRNA(Asn)/glutamyl-tRNA(Gln) amidotransferase subunit C
MSLDQETVKNIANLAKLSIPENEISEYQSDLDNILELAAQMQACDTEGVEVMTHPMDATLRLREDAVTEENQRDTLQTVAPSVDKGLYLVPKVID